MKKSALEPVRPAINIYEKLSALRVSRTYHGNLDPKIVEEVTREIKNFKDLYAQLHKKYLDWFGSGECNPPRHGDPTFGLYEAARCCETMIRERRSSEPPRVLERRLEFFKAEIEVLEQEFELIKKGYWKNGYQNH